jgi:hypothetical protein
MGQADPRTTAIDTTMAANQVITSLDDTGLLYARAAGVRADGADNGLGQRGVISTAT